MEKWCFELIKDELAQLLNLYTPGNSRRLIKIWPIVGGIEGLPVDTNKLLQQEIDIVYALGGDGTLLSLLRALYLYYSHVELPPIAAFNMVS